MYQHDFFERSWKFNEASVYWVPAMLQAPGIKQWIKWISKISKIFTWIGPIFYKLGTNRKFRKHYSGQTKHICGLHLASWLPVCDFSSKTLMNQVFSKEQAVQKGPLGPGRKLSALLFMLVFFILSFNSSHFWENCIIYITNLCIAHVCPYK